MYTLSELFKNSTHNDSAFSPETISAIESMIYTKEQRGKIIPFIKCLIRGREIRLTPEEAVRQLYVYKLIHEYGYDPENIRLEHGISFGRETKRADIVIFRRERPDTPYIIAEVKKPELTEGKEQLISYCNASGAVIGIWTNGEYTEYYHRKDPNIFESLDRIPKASETISEVLNEHWTIADLTEKDKLRDSRISLKALIQELENDVLAGAGVNAFEEVFKLIYTKLFDEMQSIRNENRFLEFKKIGGDDEDKADKMLKKKIQALFDRAKVKWPKVFDLKAQIDLMPSHLAVCVARLQNVKLFNSNLDVIDDAFEYLMSKSSKGEKGQFFTPRYVIDMCVRMLNPQENESMIDTAAGSCGFPVHTIFYVWGNIYDKLGIPRRDIFTAEVKPSECIDYVREKVFAIDFDENAVKVARTLNLIAGDGRTNIMRLNTLDYGNWDEMTTLDWMQKYSVGWLKMQDFCETTGDYSNFNFDIVMANPPFAGDIQQKEIISRYELARDSKGKYTSKIGRDILFIERNIHFLKPGGRMAIILPQGRFNNSSDKYIRDFISEHCRILAVIGLHENVFKPHTGTKTSVLLVQKWDNELCPRREDYPVFFAAMRKPGKDNSGVKIYVKDSDGYIVRDAHNHPIVDHDLYNHEGLTQDGIAEAFIEFAKREELSFFGDARFSEERYRELVSGLEVSEVMLSELISSKYFRIDADYYSKKYTHMDSQLTRAGYWLMRQIATEITDFGAFSQTNMITYLDNGILFLRNQDIKEGIINRNDNIFIAEDIYYKLTLHLQENDIVIPRVGTLGNAAMIYRDMLPATANQNLAVVRVKEGINPLYVVALLVSKIGKQQINRLSTGNVQQWLNLEAIGNIKIPALGNELQNAIGTLMNKAVEVINSSREAYTQAQNILNDAIHFTPSAHSDSNIATVSFSQVFSTGRMDAEYFMPKYDELFTHLETLPTKRLGEITDITKSIEPGSEYYSTEGVPFIRVSDITATGITPPAIRLPRDIVPDIKALYPKKDTILFSKDGTIGIAYKVDSDMEAVTSGALLHLRVTDSEVLPDYLALVLNSEVVQLQAERDSNGVIIKHWKPGDIARVVVPVFDSYTQQTISEHVRDSFTLRKESERLIALAVKSVELAVEYDENTAMNLITQEESQS